MPFSDYVPQFDEGNSSTYYRNVLGVPVRRRVIIAVMTVLVLFLIFVSALCYAGIKKSNDKNIEVSVLSYVPLERSVNVLADPCENFYEFSCGFWAKDKLVEEQMDLNVSPFSILQTVVNERTKTIFTDTQVSYDLPRTVNDAIKLYRTCISLSTKDEIEIDYLLKYFTQAFGGWPILNAEKWDDANFDWVKVSAYLMRTADIETFVKIQSIPDEYNSTRKLLYLSPAVFPSVQLSDFGAKLVLHTSLDCLNHADVQISNVSMSIYEIEETETKWRKNFELLSGRNQNRTKMTIGDLKDKMPHFDWLYYIQLVFNDTLNELGGGFSANDEIYVDNFEFLDNAMTKLKNKHFSKFELANLFGWFVMQKIWFIIPGAVSQYSAIYEETEQERDESAKILCFGVIEDLYTTDLEYLYIRNMSHTGIPDDGKILFNNIKNSLLELIGDSDWLDDSTTKSAITKLHSMDATIGFPNFLKSKSEFENFNKDFPSFSSCVMQTYFEIKTHMMFLNIYQFKSNNFNYVTSPRPITDVGAYYQPLLNSLMLPIAMFNPPFYHYGGPWFLNFGAIGSILGHEIMHGFDNLGKKYDNKGNLKNWWSNQTMERYSKHSDCFYEQYAAYKEKNSSESEVQSLNEDIADSEGLNLAYLAYKRWIKVNGADQPYLLNKKQYSPEQMFFIAFGSVWCSRVEDEILLMSKEHSNRETRVIGALSNSKDFSEVFKCPIGSPMNPDKKCHIW